MKIIAMLGTLAAITACSQTNNKILPVFDTQSLPNQTKTTWENDPCQPEHTNTTPPLAASKNSCAHHLQSTVLLNLPPALLGLLKEALNNNRDLQIARLRRDLSIQQNIRDTSVTKPQVDLQVRYDRNRLTQNAVESSREQVSGQLNLNWEADIWGRLQAIKNQADSKIVISQREYEAAQNLILANTLNQWSDSVTREKSYRLSQQTIASHVKRTHFISQRVDAGISPPLDLRLANTQLANFEVRQQQQLRQLKNTNRQFNQLLGRYPSDVSHKSLAIQSTPLREMAFPFPQLHSPEATLLQRPDILASRERLRALGFDIQAAERQLLPQLKLRLNAVATEDSLHNLFTLDHWLNRLGASLLQPVFRGGALRAAVKQKKIQRDIAVQNHLNLIHAAWQDIETRLFAIQSLDKELASLNAALKESIATETLTLEKYRTGLNSSFDLINAQNRVIATKNQVIDMDNRMFKNSIFLMLAIGLNLTELTRGQE